MKARTLPVLLLPVLLAACQQDAKPVDKGTAGGEILPASTSDAMLPLDTVRSQPPLAPRATGDKEGADKQGRDKPDAAKPRPGSSAAPSPSESTAAGA